MKGWAGKKKLITVSLLLLVFILGIALLSPVENFQRWRYGVPEGVRLQGRPVEGMLKGEVEEVVDMLARELNVKPRNAFINPKTGSIVPGIKGEMVHRSLTVERIMNAEPHTSREVKTIKVYPEITDRLLSGIDRRLSSYHTFIGGGGGSGRVENIVLATRSLNHELITPGETFSFNRVVGPRTMERGYKLAPIIVGNSVIPGRGGGICQVSSTLYNAVLNADLEVVERSPHSRPVDYVPRGKDATVSDYIDFKFKNNTDRYLLLKTSTHGYGVHISIYSS